MDCVGSDCIRHRQLVSFFSDCLLLLIFLHFNSIWPPPLMFPLSSVHFCDTHRLLNITHDVCCRFVRLINDSSRFPLCTEVTPNPIRRALIDAPIDIDDDIPEDHATFALGIFALIIVAVCCTLLMNRLTANSSSIQLKYRRSRYQLVAAWVPPCGGGSARSLIVMMMRGIGCAPSRDDTAARDSIVGTPTSTAASLTTITSNIDTTSIRLPSYLAAIANHDHRTAPPSYDEAHQQCQPENMTMQELSFPLQ